MQDVDAADRLELLDLLSDIKDRVSWARYLTNCDDFPAAQNAISEIRSMALNAEDLARDLSEQLEDVVHTL